MSHHGGTVPFLYCVQGVTKGRGSSTVPELLTDGEWWPCSPDPRLRPGSEGKVREGIEIPGLPDMGMESPAVPCGSSPVPSVWGLSPAAPPLHPAVLSPRKQGGAPGPHQTRSGWSYQAPPRRPSIPLQLSLPACPPPPPSFLQGAIQLSSTHQGQCLPIVPMTETQSRTGVRAEDAGTHPGENCTALRAASPVQPPCRGGWQP